MNKGRILIVDDDESIRELLSDLLTDENYESLVAGSGEEGLNALHNGSCDLVLLDMVLPGLHGIEVLREIKRYHTTTDVIIITNHASVETAVEAIRLGAQDYLIKPFDDLEAVVRVVKKAIDKRRLIEENERLYQELNAKTHKLESAVQRLTSLNEIGQAFHSILDLKKLLESFVNRVATELGAERVSLMLLNNKIDELLIEASVGLDEQLVSEVRIPVGEGIAGWVAQQGKALLVEDIEKDHRFQKQADRSYSTDSFISAPLLLSVPIKFRQELLGVINVNNKKGGGVFDQYDLEFVTTLASQTALAIENARIFEKLKLANLEVKETHFQVIMALAEALESKDVYTRDHSDRTVHYALAVAQRLGLSLAEQEHIKYAAILHDIGKIGIPEEILNKPARLTNEEYEVMKQHSRIGAQILTGLKALAPVVPLVLHDHERYDGTGYPDGLKGEEIPLGSRIIAVVDAYDAMTTDRIYRKSPGRLFAIKELKRYAESQFDPRVVEAFLSTLMDEERV